MQSDFLGSTNLIKEGSLRLARLCVICLVLAASSSALQSGLGEFEAQSDVGNVRHKGSVRFDAAKKEYQITGSGENMWEDKDAFHYV